MKRVKGACCFEGLFVLLNLCGNGDAFKGIPKNSTEKPLLKTTAFPKEQRLFHAAGPTPQDIPGSRNPLKDPFWKHLHGRASRARKVTWPQRHDSRR